MDILSKSVKRKRRRSRTPNQLRLNMKSVSTDPTFNSANVPVCQICRKADLADSFANYPAKMRLATNY